MVLVSFFCWCSLDIGVFDLEIGQWSECSVPCGTGIKSRELKCFNIKYGDRSTKMQVDIQNCNNAGVTTEETCVEECDSKI